MKGFVRTIEEELEEWNHKILSRYYLNLIDRVKSINCSIFLNLYIIICFYKVYPSIDARIASKEKKERNLKLFRLLKIYSSTTWPCNAFWIDSCPIESSSKKISREYGGSRGTKGRDVRMQPIRMRFFCFVPCSRSQCSTAFRRVCHFLHVCPPGSLALPHSISCLHPYDRWITFSLIYHRFKIFIQRTKISEKNC